MTEQRQREPESTNLEKEPGLGDLVLTQILYVVGSAWFGTAGKLGASHTAFWLLAIVLFYAPLTITVSYLSNIMPREGGLYQWAKLGFNESTGFFCRLESMALHHSADLRHGCHDIHQSRVCLWTGVRLDGKPEDLYHLHHVSSGGWPDAGYNIGPGCWKVDTKCGRDRPTGHLCGTPAVALAVFPQWWIEGLSPFHDGNTLAVIV